MQSGTINRPKKLRCRLPCFFGNILLIWPKRRRAPVRLWPICKILPILLFFLGIYITLQGISNILPMTVKELGKSIKFRREFLNLRQEDLAEMSGIAIKTIHLIESGSGNPSVDTLGKIATVLGMELFLQIKKMN